MLETVKLSARAKLKASPKELWPFLADTDRVNRAVGLPRIRFEPDPARLGYFRARTRFLGLPFEYEEAPFEWVEPRYYRFLRRFSRGPIREISGGIRLSEADGGSELEVFADVAPANRLGSLFARTVLSRKATEGLLRLAEEYDLWLRSAGSEPPPASPPPASVRREALDARLKLLSGLGIDPTLVRRIASLLSEGSDIEVARIRPFELAGRWSLSRQQILRLFLHSSKAGLFDLVWTAICPHCRGPASSSAGLAALPEETHCPTCDVDFECDLVETVEAVFRANAAVRKYVPSDFCIAGPANFPRIVAQLRLAPGEKRIERVRLDTTAARAHCFQTGEPTAFRLRENGGAGGRLALRCLPDRLEIDGRDAALGALELEAENRLEVESLLLLEKDTFRDSAATAASVLSLQEFRDLYPGETVGPGRELSIAKLAVLFTDLESSTALYVALGDAKAFSFVHRHFEYLVASVAKHEGGLVKTIGDAVMASFPDGRLALEAAVEMQRGWSDFLKSVGKPDGPKLKVGLHVGRTIAIDNAGRLDYFGTTVNVAARVQGEADGGEVLFTDAIRADPGVREALEALGLAATKRECELKGLPGPHAVYSLKTGK